MGSRRLRFLAWLGLAVIATESLVAASPAGHDTSTHSAAPHPAAAPADSTPAAAPNTAPVADEGTPHSPESPSHAASHPLSPDLEPRAAHDLTAGEVASLLRIGETKTAGGDFAAAEIAYRQVLAAHTSDETTRDALVGLARLFRKKNELTRAAAVYEKVIKEFPADPILPTLYLELGRTHRALGAYRLAIARFYSVINSTLKLPEEGPDTYRQLTRTAQFEVAETYFQAGDFEQAARFFSRLKLLDLAPVDRARAHFKSLYALTLSGDHEKAVAGLKVFLELYPDDESSPEARYLLSLSLRRLGRNQESLTTALALLKSEQPRLASDPKRWSYWQRKTGNQLANEFYEQGDFSSALLIYQSLAVLSDDKRWRLPVLYQVGLCQERLRMEIPARETYTTIIKQAAESTLTTASNDLKDLVTMAEWRLKYLGWQQETDRQITTFFYNTESASKPAPAPVEPSSPAPPPS